MIILLIVRVLVWLRRVRGAQGTGGRWQLRLQRRLRLNGERTPAPHVSVVFGNMHLRVRSAFGARIPASRSLELRCGARVR